MQHADALLPKPRLFAAWLALAVLLHAALLLLPAPLRDQAGSPSLALRLALHAPPRIPPPLVAEPAPPPPASAPTTEASGRRPAPSPPVEAAPVPEPASRDPAPPGVDASDLLDAVRRLERGRAEPARRLGVLRAPATPPNPRDGLPGSGRLFQGTVAPREVRIVDRWLAADGSHNVVIETPGGETLCGRAQAWDPMQPLVEHVMMFRSCGGGGERSFEMPERYRRTR